MFEELTIWHWLIIGVALMILEVFAPGAQLLWLGVSAVATALIKLAFPALGWEVEVLIFAVLSVASVLVGRKFVKQRLMETDHPTLNRRAAQYIGSVFMLEADSVNGHGRVRVGDSVWSVSLTEGSADLPKGSKVRVVGAEGTTLTVEPEKTALAS